ncbi:2027_t:CDS:2, partial [Paraglomus brasilianum]
MTPDKAEYFILGNPRALSTRSDYGLRPPPIWVQVRLLHNPPPLWDGLCCGGGPLRLAFEQEYKTNTTLFKATGVFLNFAREQNHMHVQVYVPKEDSNWHATTSFWHSHPSSWKKNYQKKSKQLKNKRKDFKVNLLKIHSR